MPQMTTTTTQWHAELTDTFGGQANYSWVNRETFELPTNATRRQIVAAGKAALGLTGVPCRTFDLGEGFELRPRNACVVAFLTPAY
jgi:hypothetical protein